MTRKVLRFLGLMAVGVTTTIVAVSPPPAAAAVPPRVVLNEVHYHAADNDPAAEFVELINTTGAVVDLSGWCIDGISFCFAAGASIDPFGLRLVTAAEYSGGLSNGGEKLTVRASDGQVVEQFTYDDGGLWPAMADGEGKSLSRRDPSLPGSNPGNWFSWVPSPGAPNPNAGIGAMPVFSDVKHTVLPAPGAPLTITAKLSGATNAIVRYRYGFGDETTEWMNVDGAGNASATIPGAPAGSLVRYRLFTQASADVSGSWPRQGDGAQYAGTTVALAARSALPQFEWFMDDAVYELAVRDLTRTGDDGYPAVFAYNGIVFDNTTVRVKGQVSRTFPKKKWKFILPAGYTFDLPGVFPEPVDEFALHSSWTDKSFIRETLASEMMTAAGVAASQTFPVRLERNGGFYGLYSYVEQQDGTWRDRFGFDDSVVYEVGGGQSFGELRINDAGLPQEILRRKYDRETFEYRNDDELRDLIRGIHGFGGMSSQTYIRQHFDVPSLVNAVAASVIIQHQDWGFHKNYRLIRNEHDKWQVVPTDFDLVLGRRYSPISGPFGDFVGPSGAFEHPGGPLWGRLWFEGDLNAMVQRRIRELTETVLDPNAVSQRVEALIAATSQDAAFDRATWGTFGFQQHPTDAARQIVNGYVGPQRNRLLGPLAAQGRVARLEQPEIPALTYRVEFPRPGRQEFVSITNVSGDTVDLSGFTIDAIELSVPGGTVLNPGQSAVFVPSSFGSLVSAFAPAITGGTYGTTIEQADEPLIVRTANGIVVARFSQLSPGTMTTITGRPNASALVSLAAVDTMGEGWVQALGCASTPGSTSNLNVDGADQIRAGLAVVQFDAAGKACLYNDEAMHLIADVQGYFAPGAIDDVADVRVLDTRPSGTKLASGGVVEINGLPGRSGLVSIVATQTEGWGYISVVPCDGGVAETSSVNFDRSGQSIANVAVVQFDASGRACLTASTTTHVIADVQAYFAVDALVEQSDARILDTRSGPLPGDGSQLVISGPPGRTGLVSLVATGSTRAGFVQVHDCGVQPGATSNLNLDAPGQTRAVLTAVRFDASGRACIFVEHAVHIVADLQATLEVGAIDDIVDERVLDTRR